MCQRIYVCDTNADACTNASTAHKKKNASQGTMHACMIEAVCQGGAEVVLSLC